jgi:hypothetical protein
LRGAQERALKEMDKAYILPVRIDNTELPGLPDTVLYIPIKKGIPHIHQLLLQKLGRKKP